jgi:Secreted repeat of unknown function
MERRLGREAWYAASRIPQTDGSPMPSWPTRASRHSPKRLPGTWHMCEPSSSTSCGPSNCDAPAATPTASCHASTPQLSTSDSSTQAPGPPGRPTFSAERHSGAAAPPLTSAAPTAASGVTGKLTVVHDAHGEQVGYNGHLLYTFAGDRAGQVTGQGFQNFFVATAGLTPAATSSAPGTTVPAAQPGGYGY